jgi:hypothetical protein
MAVLGGQHAGGHSDVFADFQKSDAQTLSVPMGGQHGKIDYSVRIEAQKTTPQDKAEFAAKRAAFEARGAASRARVAANKAANNPNAK